MGMDYTIQRICILPISSSTSKMPKAPYSGFHICLVTRCLSLPPTLIFLMDIPFPYSKFYSIHTFIFSFISLKNRKKYWIKYQIVTLNRKTSQRTQPNGRVFERGVGGGGDVGDYQQRISAGGSINKSTNMKIIFLHQDYRSSVQSCKSSYPYH